MYKTLWMPWPGMATPAINSGCASTFPSVGKEADLAEHRHGHCCRKQYELARIQAGSRVVVVIGYDVLTPAGSTDTVLAAKASAAKASDASIVAGFRVDMAPMPSERPSQQAAEKHSLNISTSPF